MKCVKLNYVYVMFLFLFELLIMNDHNVSSSINFKPLE